MAIPLPTTTITIKGKRPESSVDPDAEGYDAPATPPGIVASGLNAAISAPSASRDDALEVERWRLRVDPCDLRQFDTVIDDKTGVEYEVETVSPSNVDLFGLEHVQAVLKLQTGLPGGAP